MNLEDAKLDSFDYFLPPNLVPTIPLDCRDDSKLLIYKDNKISEGVFKNINSYLDSKSTFVVNNTRVIHARLFFQKESGAIIEIFCLEPHFDFQSKYLSKWKCMVKNGKKWKKGKIKNINNSNFVLNATLIEKLEDCYLINFEWNEDITFYEVLKKVGKMPIPPYFNRESQKEDEIWYQTHFGIEEGAVAAPTAALHFTPELIDSLKINSHQFISLTLHVGAGTFKPIETEWIFAHKMHKEEWSISLESLQSLYLNYDNLIAVGTTSLRTLESVYWSAFLISKDKNTVLPFFIAQNLPYQSVNNLTWKESLEILIIYCEENKLTGICGNTQIMIVPGYKIRSIKALITNFHQPKSTLLLLVSAWVGIDWKNIYKYALENDFRFLSYGDSSILFSSNFQN